MLNNGLQLSRDPGWDSLYHFICIQLKGVYLVMGSVYYNSPL